MIVDITPATSAQIKNPDFAAYVRMYDEIYEDFMQQVAATGIEIDPVDRSEEAAEKRRALRKKGVQIRNTDRSLYVNAISPACVACRKGIGTATFFISLKCHRDCYYCFNPNQEDYEYYCATTRNLPAELDEIHTDGMEVRHLALTGGEPLLHRDEAVAFFARARELFPGVDQRLYTCGDHVDEAILAALRDAGLDEIRFSIRVHDVEHARQKTLERIALAKQFIPRVMVEMPVPPGSGEIMRDLLLALDEIGIFSINLLELCYPFRNAEAFNSRGFKVKNRPFRTLYNYWYAGGVPIEGSELECLDLLDFAVERGLSIGVHYCSLENKFTGQNYQQNAGQRVPSMYVLSENDYLLKSAKVFGRDVPPVLTALRRRGYTDYTFDEDTQCLTFSVDAIKYLKGLDVEIGIATSTIEQREDGPVLREMKIDLTTPQTFKRYDV